MFTLRSANCSSTSLIRLSNTRTAYCNTREYILVGRHKHVFGCAEAHYMYILYIYILSVYFYIHIKKEDRYSENKSMKISFRWKIQPTFYIAREIYDMHILLQTHRNAATRNHQRYTLLDPSIQENSVA